MKTCKTFLAADLGAGSGRVMAARYDGSTLSLEAAHRFDNVPVSVGGHLHWNLLSLYAGVRDGIAAALRDYGPAESVGVDTWGVDYGLLDGSGRLLGLPYAYRDVRNDGMADKVCARLGRRRVYDRTGIQFIDFNTVFQLHTERIAEPSLLDLADRALFMPDLIDFALCGVEANEATIASTSGLVDLRTGDFSAEILGRIGVSPSLFRTPVRPGTVLGPVRGVPGLEGVPVVTVGSHDTASAVASVPADPSTSWGYLATGTWALLGIETPSPILGDASYELNYTHEGAVNGTFRFLKNCTGMWMVQELRRAWTKDGAAPGWDELMHEAEASEPFRSLVDPDWAPFASPGRMPEKIADFCRLVGQPVPETRGQFYRTAMESVVMRYREVWGELETLSGRKRDVLHMIGGATRDAMHCRMAADAMRAEIACGPVEGAAMGNAVAQLVGLGDLASFDEGRHLVRDSIDMARISPSAGAAAWDDAFPRWLDAKKRAATA